MWEHRNTQQKLKWKTQVEDQPINITFLRATKFWPFDYKKGYELYTSYVGNLENFDIMKMV